MRSCSVENYNSLTHSCGLPSKVGTALLGSSRGTEADVRTTMKERTYVLRSAITMDNRGLLDNPVFVLYLLLMCQKVQKWSVLLPPFLHAYIPPAPQPILSHAWHVSPIHVLVNLYSVTQGGGPSTPLVVLTSWLTTQLLCPPYPFFSTFLLPLYSMGPPSHPLFTMVLLPAMALVTVPPPLFSTREVSLWLLSVVFFVR